MSSELPQGWATTKLDDVCSLITDGTHQTPNYVPAGVPFLSTANLRPFTTGFDFSQYKRFISHEEHAALTKRCRPDKGDILISKCGTIGRVKEVDVDLSFSIFVGLALLKPRGGIFQPKFAEFWLNCPRVTKQFEELSPGSTRRTLTLKGIKSLEIPVPPLGEQGRIVAKLTALLAKVDACQQRLAKIPVLLKRFRQSVLAAACSGRLTADWREENESEAEVSDSVEVPDEFPSLPETWRWQLLESVCERIVDCPHSTPKWTDSGRLCARTTNFKPGFLDLSEVRYVSDATFNERIERLRPKPGDVLYSREGGILGIACMIPPKVDLCLGQRMMLFRAKSDFTGTLLMHWLNSRLILRRVQELTGGSASPHLNVRDIKAFPTPIPPLAEQQEIVRRVEGMFALADQIEARFQKAKAQVDKLTPSLLARAFRGQLVPQNPNDEPAEKLLERILQDRTKNTNSRTRKR